MFWSCFCFENRADVCLVKSLAILSFYLSKQLKESPKAQILGAKPLLTL